MNIVFPIPEELVDELAERVRAKLAAEGEHEREAASPYMTVKEAAEFLRCSRQAVDDMLRRGRLTRFKRDQNRNGAVLVLRAEVESLVREEAA